MGMSYRNFISSNVLGKLEKRFDITFLVLEKSKLADLLVSKNKEIVYLKIGLFHKVIRRCSTFIEKLQYYNFYQKKKTNTIKKYIERDKENKLFNFFYLSASFIGKAYDDFNFLSFHYQFFLPKKIRKLIVSYENILLLSSDDPLDKSLLKIATKNHMHSYLMIHSWDNLPARGYFSARPSKVLVWNDEMKEQAIELHGMSENDVYVVGVPQFYFYKKIEEKVQYNNFVNSYCIDNKVITYTCSASRVFPDEELLIRELIDYIADRNIYLILRLHPTERCIDYISKFSNIENVILDKPNGNFAAKISNDLSNDEQDIRKFVSLMKYSNVVINLASTISLDAIIFDTPVVCVAFNLESNVSDKWNNAEGWYNSSHYKTIVNSGAVKVSYSMDELISYIELYLSNSEIDRENRYSLAHDFCKIDYDVKKKLFEYIG